MKLLLLACIAICIALPTNVFSQTNEMNWPNWRGPNMDGVSAKGRPPIEWSESHHIKWKIPIPGRGLGTPVIWGNQIFITTAIELEGDELRAALQRINETKNQSKQTPKSSLNAEYVIQFKVYSFSLINGTILWEKVIREQIPFNYIIAASSYASASCATDGKNVIASFGTYGIYCFDMDGKKLWEKDLGIWEDPLAIGEGSSPIIHDDKVIIVWDHEGASKIFALDKTTGDVIWQTDRNEHHTWATPIVVNVNEKPQVLVAGNYRSVGYNLDDGKEIWHIKGLSESVIPSPVSDGKKVYFMAGDRNGEIQAVKLEKATGDITNTESHLWSLKKNTSAVPSPVLINGRLYFLKGSRAQISCVNADSGTINFDSVRPKGMIGTFTSPVAAHGYVYIIDKRGLCSVIEEGAIFKLVAQNKLDDTFDASPAIVGNNLILKGSNNLYCISE